MRSAIVSRSVQILFVVVLLVAQHWHGHGRPKLSGRSVLSREAADACVPRGDDGIMGCSKPQLTKAGNLVETRSDGPAHWVSALARQHYERQAVLLHELCHIWGDGARASAL